jgi:PPM family protein phosphatase
VQVDADEPPPTEEPTMVGVIPDLPGEDNEDEDEDEDDDPRREHPDGRDGAVSSLTVATPLVTPRTQAPRESPRLARTQGRTQGVGGNRPRGESRSFKLVAALISLSIVVFLFGGGAYLASRELFFVGTNPDGIVTLYRGLPYDFVVPFYEQSYVSGLPASEIPPARRKTLLNHNLRSQNNAVALIRDAERGQLEK